MASTGYLSRVIFKPHTGDSEDYSNYNFAGSYKLLVKAKTIPSPLAAPNNVESTTLEDPAQTFLKGIKQSNTVDITGNLEKEYLDALDALGESKVDIIILYGSSGTGDVAKYAFVGQATATPSDISGPDSVLEMTCSVIQNSSPIRVTDAYTVTESDGTFTVAKKSS